MADLDAGRFDDGLKARVQENLAGFERQPIAPDGRRLAAVAVVLLADDEGRACFLLTRRTATLRVHARQWALPGGRIDVGESAEGAALRELREEVGLVLDAGSVLGILDDYGTRSGFIITPVVVWAGEKVELAPNPAEVAHVYQVPLAELDKPRRPPPCSTRSARSSSTAGPHASPISSSRPGPGSDRPSRDTLGSRGDG